MSDLKNASGDLASGDLESDDDAGIADLLRSVGPREEPTEQLAAEVRRAVQAEWQATVNARLRRRRFIGYSLAASIAGVALTTAIALKLTADPPFDAVIARVEGTAEIIGVNGQRRPLTVGEHVVVGEGVQTDANARVALDMGSGISTRIDRDSKMEVTDDRRIALTKGVAYVDALHESAQRSELVLDTKFGSVRHVGTQYQVRMLSDGIEVGIREGRVEVTGRHGTNTGATGERLHISENGSILRSALSPQDSSWQWATAIVPAFDIADRPLHDFLVWMARETGRALTFDTPEARRASEVRLRGSIEGLDLDTALTAVLSTTTLRQVNTDDGSIRIATGSTIESNSAERPTP